MEHQWTSGMEKYKKIEVLSTCGLSSWWALNYHIALGETCLGAYPGVGAFHSSRQDSYLGTYPRVGAYPGYYGIYNCIYNTIPVLCIQSVYSYLYTYK